MAKRTKKSQTEEPQDAVEVVIDAEQAPESTDPVEEFVTQTDDKTPQIEEEPADIPDLEPPVAETLEPVPTPEPEPAPPPPYSEPNRENSVLLPMILGGLIAGGLGYGAAYLGRPVIDVPLDQQVAAHAAQITALETAVAAPPPTVDLAPLEERLATFSAQIGDQISGIDERIDGLDDRVAAVEKQPSADGTLQDTAVAAFQRELDELRAQTEQMSADAAAALQATRDEASAIENNAIENARRATARASIARIQGALESGAGFADILVDLDDAIDAPIPDALIAAAEGVPTLGKLQADFPAAAREALTIARAEGASGEEATGVGAFLRNQLNVRSVTPQEGDSADAVLSRAEAALRIGQLNETLAEVALLPDVSRAALSDWLSRAQMRAAAIEAAATLTQSLSDN